MKTVSVVALLFVVSAGVCRGQEEAPYPQAPNKLSSVASIVSEDEPGTRLIISGKVYRSDRTTPYSGLILYFYQTDVTGVYNKVDGSYRKPRLHGWARTDEKGSYELRTIKPGSYPRRREAAHIHVTVKTGSSARWLDAYLFEGDPNLSQEEARQVDALGRFSPVLRLTQGTKGELIAVRDIVVLD